MRPEDISEVSGYSVSYDDLVGSHPEVLERFDWQSPLVRANLTDWIITSFNVARQIGQAHLAFFLWCDSRLGFDSEATLVNFSEAAENYPDFDFLSPQEIENITEAFRMQKAHTKILDKRQIEDNPMTDLDILREVTYYLGEDAGIIGGFEGQWLPDYLSKDRLGEMSKEEFLKNCEYYRQNG